MLFRSGAPADLLAAAGTPRALTSASTHRAGVVAPGDLAAAIAAFQDGAPALGDAVSTAAAAPPVALERRFLERAKSAVPIELALVILVTVIGLGAIAVLARGSAPRPLVRALAWGAMAVPGLYLASLGGSLYYAVAVALVLIAGLLVLRRKVWGIWLYWTVLLGTAAWSLWEVGLDGWALMPRLVFLAVGGLWLLWLAPTDRPVSMKLRLSASLALVVGMAALLGLGSLKPPAIGDLPAQAAAGATTGEWTHWGKSYGYFKSPDDADAFHDEMCYMLACQMAAPN